MTPEARREYDLQEHTTRAMSRMYERPEEAYRRLNELDENGIERFRQNPNEIGPLKEGVHLTQDEIGGLVSSKRSYDLINKAARNQIHQANTDREAEGLRQRPANSPEHTSAEAKMNDSLAGAPTVTHHLSI